MPSPLKAVPGEEAVCEVRVRNTGSLVDEFSFEVLGHAAAWTQVAPPMLRLLPATEGVVTLRVIPPRQPTSSAGQLAFGLKVRSSEAADEIVREGVLEVAPYVELSAELVPRTSRTRIAAQHRLTVANQGNAIVEATVAASDPDELLKLEPSPPAVRAGPGGQAAGVIRVRARKLMLTGRGQPRPFQVLVQALDDAPAPPIALDGTMVQRPLLPWWLLLPLAVVVLVLTVTGNVAIVAAAAVLGAAVLVVDRVRQRRGALAPPPGPPTAPPTAPPPRS